MSKSDYELELYAMADRLLATVNSQKPSKKQLAELREALKTAPALVQELGDLSDQVKHQIIHSLGGEGQAGLHIAVKARAKALAEELGAEGASPLERLLIDQVVIAWLRLQAAEFAYQTIFKGGGVTLPRAAYLEKKLTATQGRYLRAIEGLARVRRLLSRTQQTQINIAVAQQVMQSG